MHISFWEQEYIDNTGSIIISGASPRTLEKLEKNFQITKIATITGHTEPTYALHHSEELEDCSRDEFMLLLEDGDTEEI